MLPFRPRQGSRAPVPASALEADPEPVLEPQLRVAALVVPVDVVGAVERRRLLQDPHRGLPTASRI